MNRDELEQLFVSQLYQEISEEDQKRLDDWLEQHPDDRQELNDLHETLELLNCVEDKEVPDTIKPIQMPVLMNPKLSRHRWKGWAIAAAACLALFLIATTQGFLVQVGDIRIAFGSFEENQMDRDVFQREIIAAYLPVMEQLVNAVETVQNAGEQTAERLDSVERSLQVLAVYRNAERKLNDRKLEKYLAGFAREVDRRFNRLYQVSYNTIPGQNLESAEKDG